ncbi:hypothetical protein [Bacillus sp. 3255]|uniref:hypothetical protein n=1 Tax=Bacillus sp. 3255 TaxID=2817904 RepID=UPI00286CFBAD|nr:hypothetical protein [Bacillus sp. 3255]
MKEELSLPQHHDNHPTSQTYIGRGKTLAIDNWLARLPDLFHPENSNVLQGNYAATVRTKSTALIPV